MIAPSPLIQTQAPLARARIRNLEGSRIREVANAGLGRADIAAFWFGESDQPTPSFIREAAVEALGANRTFYGHNLGGAPLRERLSRYLGELHGRRIASERIAVTSSGVSALMVAMQALLDPGDRVVCVTPVWPNVVEIPRILNAELVRVPLAPQENRWRLDLDRLFDALTPGTRLLLLNSPNNPTGWTLKADARLAILERCRAHGIWLIGDDVYERLAYDNAPSAPSFLPLVEPDDRFISANSFSKAWRMTGWRLGWLVAPPSITADLGKLLEYNTSCAPDFIQHAAVAALEHGEPQLAAMHAELAAKRARLLAALRDLPGVEAPTPDGGLYAFFRIEGCTDSLAMAKALVADVGLGLAPGAAFGPEGEGWLRWCFAAHDDRLDDGISRLRRYMGVSN